MKRFVLASVAALALTLACQQTASANGGWSLHLSGNLTLSGTWWCNTPPCPPAYYYSYPAPPYYAPAYYPGYAPAHAAAPAPAAQPQSPAVAAQPPVQQTGYYYYGNYYGNYGYYQQVPSYWYGR